MIGMCEWYFGDTEQDFDKIYTSCGQVYDYSDVEGVDICPNCINEVEYAK